MATEETHTTTPLASDQPHFHPAAVWGIVGVLALLINAIVRLAPLAAQPITDGMLVWQWVLYVGFIVFMAYSEGYKGFQLAFAPRVVARALALPRHKLSIVLLAPIYCMGLIHATRKRLIVSWVLLVAIVTLILLVRLLPYPYRSIIDAGVVVGLSWGSIAVLAFTIQALRGAPPQVPTDLPTS